MWRNCHEQIVRCGVLFRRHSMDPWGGPTVDSPAGCFRLTQPRSPWSLSQDIARCRLNCEAATRYIKGPGALDIGYRSHARRQ